MRSWFGRAALAAVVCGMVALTAGSRVARASTARGSGLTLPPVIITASPVRTTKAEPHPEVWAAIRSLDRAKHHLQVAAHDFGGHRVEAIAAIDAALAQLHACLEYDK